MSELHSLRIGQSGHNLMERSASRFFDPHLRAQLAFRLYFGEKSYFRYGNSLFATLLHRPCCGREGFRALSLDLQILTYVRLKAYRILFVVYAVKDAFKAFNSLRRRSAQKTLNRSFRSSVAGALFSIKSLVIGNYLPLSYRKVYCI